MSHDWMIRVLEDLSNYASLNGMRALAEHLDHARMLALAEAANLPFEVDEAETID